MVNKLSGIDNEDDYSLHHGFIQKRGETDQAHIQQLASYITERGNQFDTHTSIKNFVKHGSHLTITNDNLLNNNFQFKWKRNSKFLSLVIIRCR